jgi:hypothetical protein
MRARYLVISTVVVVVVVVAYFFAAELANPLARSEAEISRGLLSQTPIGTAYADVRTYIHSRGWFDASNQGSDGKTGPLYLRGELGEYLSIRTPFRVTVTVFWEFDEGEHLAEIRSWKTIDAF